MTAPTADAGYAPTAMMEVELTRPLPTLWHNRQNPRVWVLGRLYGEPIGVCVVGLDQEESGPGRDALAPDRLGELLWPEFAEPVTSRFTAAGLEAPAALPGTGLPADAARWPPLRRRSQVLAEAPFVSVIICTRDRPDHLRTCLHSLNRQDYPAFEVVVVDNAPSSHATRALVESTRINAVRGEVSCHYVTEPRPGLSWARNAGIAAASGEILAFIDDEEPDSDWLASLAAGFARGADISAVTGMILPAELDTQARQWFEQLGGHSKGRGFSAAVFSRTGPQSPLYPLPPFGAGGNMAFRREALASIGGFDVALGSGTPARACEDTLALTLTLLAGYRIAYEPTALIRHHHRQAVDDLGDQLHGYGVGLTAFYAALLRHRPGVLPELLRLAPTAIGYLRGTGAASTGPRKRSPVRLRLRQRLGMLSGPVAYLASRRRQARVASEHSRQAPSAGRA